MIQDSIDYSFLIDSQLNDFVSQSVKLSYKADNIGDFLDYLGNTFDLYIDIDNNKKIIKVKRTKKEFFKFAIPFFQSQTQQVGGTATAPEVKVSEILEELKLELDSLKDESANAKVNENLSKNLFSYLINNVSGTVTVVATPSYMKEAKRIIKRFRDNLMINVNVKFTIFTLRLDKDHAFGVDWSFLNIKSKQSIVGGISGKELKIDGGTSFAGEATSLAASANSGMIKLGVDSNNFTVGAAAGYLNKFGTVADVKSFNVVTMNNFKIVQQLGTNQDFISKVTVEETTDDKGNKTTTRTPEVTKINSGMNLIVVPRYNSITQKMTLKIVPIISSVAFETQTIDGNILKLPTESITNLTNNVIVKRGEKIILSGIILDEKTDRYKGLADEDAGTALRGMLGQQEDKIVRMEVIVMIEADILE
jgi:type II secretory pathway component GspD/PulD (secretin)